MSNRRQGVTAREVELARIDLIGRQWTLVLGFMATGFRVCGVGCVVWIIISGLERIVLAQPDQISALAKLTNAIGVGTIVGYVSGFVGIGAYVRERRGKKRAIRKVGELRKQLEQNDEGGRSTSRLTETGDTPEELLEWN